MTVLTDDAIIDGILKRESGGKPDSATGIIDHPADRGGPTSIWGITLTLLQGVRSGATMADLAALTREQAAKMYRTEFITGPGFDNIANPDVRALVVDSAVQHNPNWTCRAIQRVLGLGQDGIFGPITIAAVNQAPAKMLYAGLLDERYQRYGRIVSGDKALEAARAAGFDTLQAENAAGWMNRMSVFTRRAGSM